MAARTSLLLALLALLSSCSGGTGVPAHAGGAVETSDAQGPPLPFRLSPEQARGREVYDKVCRTCHGDLGQGDSFNVTDHPPDLTSAEYSGLSVAELAGRFNGKGRERHEASTMSVVSAQQIRDALSYVPLLSYPSDWRGSALNGREVYRRYCTLCHGVKGDGNGSAAQLLVTPPADFFKSDLVAQRDFEGLIRRTRDGPSGPHASAMPAWGIFFDEEMLNDVVAYLTTFRSRAPMPTVDQ